MHRLWWGQAGSLIGDGVRRIAMLWWLAGNGGVACAAAVLAVSTAAGVAGSLASGHANARRSPAQVLMAADAARMAASACLAVLLSCNLLSPWIAGALLTASAAAGGTFTPTLRASLPSLNAPGALLAANARLSLAQYVGGAAGPALGGLLTASVGYGAALAVDTASFGTSLLSVASIAALRSRLPAPASQPPPYERRDTLHQFRDPNIRRLIAVTAALNAAMAPVAVLLLGYSRITLHAGAGGYGTLETALAIGLAAGTLTAARLPEHAAGGALPVAIATAGLGLIALTVLPGLGAAATVLGCVGVSLGIAASVLPSIAQRVVPPARQPALFGIMGAIGQALRPLSQAAAAPTTVYLGAPLALATVGAVLMTAAAGSRHLTPHTDPSVDTERRNSSPRSSTSERSASSPRWQRP